MSPSVSWVFGYGSLCWRPDFPFIRSSPARLDGYVRRFYQISTDHRGNSDYPGRVVTVIPTTDTSASIFGVAYQIDARDADAVIAYLTKRECQGYEPIDCAITLRPSAEVVTAVVYVGRVGNPHWGGPQPDELIAQYISRAVGLSGKNADYLFALEQFNKRINQEDQHITKLATLVRSILSDNNSSLTLFDTAKS